MSKGDWIRMGHRNGRATFVRAAGVDAVYGEGGAGLVVLHMRSGLRVEGVVDGGAPAVMALLDACGQVGSLHATKTSETVNAAAVAR